MSETTTLVIQAYTLPGMEKKKLPNAENVMQHLLKSNLNQDSISSALVAAVCADKLEQAKLLIEAGADLNVNPNNDLLPNSLLYIAYKRDPVKLSMLKLLVKNGAQLGENERAIYQADQKFLDAYNSVTTANKHSGPHHTL